MRGHTPQCRVRRTLFLERLEDIRACGTIIDARQALLAAIEAPHDGTTTQLAPSSSYSLSNDSVRRVHRPSRLMTESQGFQSATKVRAGAETVSERVTSRSQPLVTAQLGLAAPDKQPYQDLATDLSSWLHGIAPPQAGRSHILDLASSTANNSRTSLPGDGASLSGALESNRTNSAENRQSADASFAHSSQVESNSSGFSRGFSTQTSNIFNPQANPVDPSVSRISKKIVFSDPPISAPPAAPGITVTIASNIPVNADSENNEQPSRKKFGFPLVRDFSVRPIPGGDAEIVGGTVSLSGLGANGVFGVSITYLGGTGKIALWADKAKVNPLSMPPPGTQSFPFFVEGVHESSFAQDVKLKFIYNLNGQQYFVDQLLTVTQLITQFTAYPARDITGGQNIYFTNYDGLNNGIGGLSGEVIPLGVPGISFTGIVTRTGLTGDLVFIQDGIDAINGYNNTRYLGSPIGWRNAAGTVPGGANLKLTTGSFPITDVSAGATSPEYTSIPAPPDPNTYEITGEDAPKTGSPASAASGTVVDLLYKFQLFLVWKYSDGSYYPLAYTYWQANFLASSVNGAAPITFINIKHGVTSDGKPYPNNDTPPSITRNNGVNLVTFNGNVGWVPVP